MLKKIGKTIEGAGETLKNWGYVRDMNKKTKKMKERLVNQKAKKNYKAIRGEKAYNKSQDMESLYNKDRRDINKMKKNIRKNKYGYIKV